MRQIGFGSDKGLIPCRRAVVNPQQWDEDE